MASKNPLTENFGEVISTYTIEEAIKDEILIINPRQDAFKECNLITTNLLNKLLEMALERNKTRIFEIDNPYLLGCLLLCAKKIYEDGVYEGDQDKDFFVTPPTEEGVKVWFVRNETGKLTAMLPEDY